VVVTLRGAARGEPIAMKDAYRTYVLVHTIDWLLLASIAGAAVRWLGVDVWIAAAVVGSWIAKDMFRYPSARRYYTSEPPQTRMMGNEGEALSAIDPQGFARIHGEIWQVYIEPGAESIDEGERVRVRAITGLHLLVDRVATRASRSVTEASKARH
jgi:membrane-bound ClpP family serine protease